MLLAKNVAFVNVIDHVGNYDKEYWWDIKNSRWINNLKLCQKYQNSFVISDEESNFEYIYPVFILLSVFSFVKK